MIGLLTIGLVSAAALLLYLRTSELLPFGLFGLLGIENATARRFPVAPPG
ncbi:hypothetical protein [Microbacterium lacticum]